jgi:glutaminyl-peptide cyclotransferase
MRVFGSLVTLSLLAFAASVAHAAAPAACAEPRRLVFQVDGEIRRSAVGFTQGLEFRGGTLYESTGAIADNTKLSTIDGQGRVTVLADFGKRFFGEGLTIFRDRIYQLSWQNNAAFVYDLKGAELKRMRNPRDGWGLTNDGTRLIATDGGDKLWFHDPESFATTGNVQVRWGSAPLNAVNELEYVEGKIYGNVFMTWEIVRIDPRSGCVEAVSDLSHLWDRMRTDEKTHIVSNPNFVLNGIAYDAARKRFFVTGKSWKTIFIGRFVEAG